MANYRAVANGNWDNLATWQDNGGGSFAASTVLPGINDDVYTNTFTVNININIIVNSLRNHNATGITTGGGFVVSIDGITILAVSTITANGATNSVNTVTVSINSPSVCNITTGSIFPGNILGHGINLTGSGTLNITCLTSTGANATGVAVINSGTGTINFTGKPIGGQNIYSSGITNLSTGTVYITGIAIGYTGASVGCAGVINTSTGSLYITGGATSGTKKPGVESTTNGYIKILGPITGTEQPGFTSTGVNAVNILSGPFISGPTGVAPFNCFKVHYEITTGSYYEFRDSSTNGAGTAPATQLVAPGTAVDSPDEADVRQGVDYAFSTLTGTLIVPDPSDVRKSVPTDDTVGTAELTSDDLFDAIETSPHPIAVLIRNLATEQKVGAIVAAAVS